MLTICRSRRKKDGVMGAARLTFGSSAALNLLGVRANIIDDLTLEVGYLEVPSFAHDVVLHSAELVELEGTMTRLD